MSVKSINAARSATIKRLRNGKPKHWQAGRQEGRKDGVEWARDIADYERLADVCEGRDLDWYTFDGLPDCSYEEVHTFRQRKRLRTPLRFVKATSRALTEGATAVWEKRQGRGLH